MAKNDSTHPSTSLQLASEVMPHCPGCGAPIHWNLDTTTEACGTCETCTLTFSLSQWQRYATDAAFRAYYAPAVANAHTVRNAYVAGQMRYGVLTLTRAGLTTYSVFEFEIEQEVKLEIKLAADQGYVATWDNVTYLCRERAEQAAHS